jgi:penicillin-binding protein 1A
MSLDSNGKDAAHDSGALEPGPEEMADGRDETAHADGTASAETPEGKARETAPSGDTPSPETEPADTTTADDSQAGPESAAEAEGGGQAEGGTGADSDSRPRRTWRDRARGVGQRAAALRRSKVAWAIAVVLFVLWVGWERCGIQGCPSVSTLASYQPGGASVLLDRNGDVFADLGPVDHSVVEIESLPEYVPAAFVAVEDKRFYDHDGVDWRRVVGAAIANVKAGRTTQGSSTITMQLSRNVFSDRIRASERTIRRKLLEVRVARDIERRFSKDEILELYLNHIYFGGGAWGIEAAARHYFGRPASDLSLEQAALLAALPKAPANYDPRRHEERARSRRDLVLGLMAEQGMIAADAADEARSSRIRVASARDRRDDTPRATHFVQVVRDMLEDKLGEDLYSRPLRIHTTLDTRAQRAAQEELEAQLRRVENGAYGRFTGPRKADWQPGDEQTDYLQGAAVVMDNATGNVLAMVGGRDATQSSFNRATQAHRQAGSAFKPFVYAAALTRGYSPAQWLDDSPYRLVGDDGKPWEPRNYDGEFRGPITLRDALVMSRNVPTIRLASQVGEKNVARLAHAAGVDAELRESPMIALGIAEVSPLELTAAYTAFSGGGRAVEPRFVTAVVDVAGDTIWGQAVRIHEVLDPGVAYLMTDLMRDAVDRGTGRSVRSAGYRGLASGKTGTTNDGADAWFIGYTPRITAGFWVGFDRPREIAPRASGGSVAGYAWGRMMRRIQSWAGGDPWQQPSRVVRVSLDPETGLALEEGCEPRRGDSREEFFLRGSTPETTCPDGAGGRSLLGRIGAWIGDLFGGDDGRDVRVESSRPRAQGQDARRRGPEYQVRPPDFDDARFRSRSGNEWADGVMDEVERALEERRERQEDAIEALRDFRDLIEDRLDGDSRDEVERLLDAAMRSVERAAREQTRSREQEIEAWLRNRVRQLQRDGSLDRDDRQQLESEIRRALRSWM